MVNFADMVDYIEEVGGFEVVLPFLLVFTITYAILGKLEIFGKDGDKKKINVVFSFVVALLFIRNTYLVGLLQRFLPNVSMFMVIILMFILLTALTAGKKQDEWNLDWLAKAAAAISFIFVLWALTSDKLSDFVDLPWWIENWDDQTKSTVLFVGIFIIIIWWVTRSDGDVDEETRLRAALEKVQAEKQKKAGKG